MIVGLAPLLLRRRRLCRCTQVGLLLSYKICFFIRKYFSCSAIRYKLFRPGGEAVRVWGIGSKRFCTFFVVSVILIGLYKVLELPTPSRINPGDKKWWKLLKQSKVMPWRLGYLAALVLKGAGSNPSVFPISNRFLTLFPADGNAL
jgi:hypothetical protein